MNTAHRGERCAAGRGCWTASIGRRYLLHDPAARARILRVGGVATRSAARKVKMKVGEFNGASCSLGPLKAPGG